MPGEKTHKRYAMKYLNQFTPFLNHVIDAPSQELKHAHRTLFHDYEFLEYIERKLGKDARLEVLLHISVDLESVRPVEERRFLV